MSSWQKVYLGDVIDLFDHVRIPLNANERAARRGLYPYYGAQGIIDHVDGFLFDGRFLLVPEDGENLNSRKLPIAYFAEGKFWVNNHAHILRAKAGVADDVFLKHWLNNCDIRPYVTGAAQPKLSQANLKRMELWLPPFETQNRIASILGAYDDMIEVNRQRIALLEEMARRLFEEWFVYFRFPGHEGHKIVETPNGLLPEGWQRIGVGQATRNFDRLRKPLSKPEREKMKGPYPYFGAAKIFDYINQYLFEGLHLLVAEDGSVITSDGFPVLQLVSGRFWVNNHAHVLTGAGDTTTEFLYLALRRYPIGGHITGAAQPKITQANLNRIPIVVAPPPIMSRFNVVVQPLIGFRLSLEAANVNLQTTRDLLLPRLISGELSVAIAERELEAVA